MRHRFRETNRLLHGSKPSSEPGRGGNGHGRRGLVRFPSPPSANLGARSWSVWCAAGPALLVIGCALLLVGTDVLERRFFPDIPTAARHALLTARAVIVAGLGSGVIYVVMHRHQQRLSATAERLSHLLETYPIRSPTRARFENPRLTDRINVVDCDRPRCPPQHTAEGRCWQLMALAKVPTGREEPGIPLEQCHACPVYRRSCPDSLTRLGESFNNLMFLLDQEASENLSIRAQLVEKEKMVAIGQMAAGIAHEVGNPLSSISSIVQVLKRKSQTEASLEQLDLLQTHIQRISTTVRHLSTLARPAPERWEFSDLSATLEEAVRLVSFDRRARNITIDFLRPDSLPRTFALCGQIQQVFLNVLLNALDAMPSGGTLTIRATSRARRLQFRFEDTGPGIPKETGRRIFEPFYTTKQPGHGTGLGLAVSYGIVQKHGGIIDFHDRDGGGTVFTVDVPILNEAPESEDEPSHGLAGGR